MYDGACMLLFTSKKTFKKKVEDKKRKIQKGKKNLVKKLLTMSSFASKFIIWNIKCCCCKMQYDLRG